MAARKRSPDPVRTTLGEPYDEWNAAMISEYLEDVAELLLKGQVATPLKHTYAAVQYALWTQGLYPHLLISGEWNKDTVEALEDFQMLMGLPQTGRLYRETLLALSSAMFAEAEERHEVSDRELSEALLTMARVLNETGL